MQTQVAGQVLASQNAAHAVALRVELRGVYGDAQLAVDYGENTSGNAAFRGHTHFVCQTHGATYEPLTGLCIAGPCVGASLKPLKVEVIKDEVWFNEPD